MEERRLCYVHASGHKASSEQSQQRQVLQDKLISLSPADQALVKEIWASYDQAPGPLRPLILDGILHRSCLAQLSLLSSVTQSLLKIDYIKSVPFELAVRIFQYLDAKSLCHAAQVSKTWNRISNDDLIWHRMCNQHIDKKCNKCGWGLPLMQSLQLKKKSNKRKFVEEQVAPEETRLDVSESSSTNASNSSIEPSISTRGGQEKSETELVEALPRTPTRSTSFTKRPWKEIYAERLVMERNWRKGVYSVKDFVGHTDAVMCLQFDEHSRRLVTGSFDTTLRVWDTDSDTCIAVLKGHTAVVRAVQFDTSTIISGSIDSTIRIWNAQTFECVRVLTGHNSQGITCLDFQEKLLVSGSVDGSVQIWDLSTASVSLLTGGHRDWVNCVKIVNKHLVASSSDDATLKIWDIASKTPIMTFSGHMGPIQKFKILSPYYASVSDDDKKVPSGKLVTASLDNTVKVWDLASGSCLQTLFGHTEGVWCVDADSLRVVSGSHDKRIMIWDSIAGTPMYSLLGHQGSVNCCQLSDSGVFSGDETGVVKFWNYLPDDFPYKRDSPISLKSL